MRNQSPFIFLFILIIAFFPSCSREKTNIVEPNEVVVLFMDDIVKGDFQSAYQYIETPDKEQGGIGRFVSESDSMLKVVDYEIVSVKQDKFLAEVTLNLTTEYEGKRKTATGVIITLVKEEENWKIDYWPGP